MFVLPTLVYTLLGAAIAWAASTPKPADVVVRDNGVNCGGSGFCGDLGVSTSGDLVNYINQIPDDAWYRNGAQIGAVVFAQCCWCFKSSHLFFYYSLCETRVRFLAKHRRSQWSMDQDARPLYFRPVQWLRIRKPLQ